MLISERLPLAYNALITDTTSTDHSGRVDKNYSRDRAVNVTLPANGNLKLIKKIVTTTI